MKKIAWYWTGWNTNGRLKKNQKKSKKSIRFFIFLLSTKFDTWVTRAHQVYKITDTTLHTSSTTYMHYGICIHIIQHIESTYLVRLSACCAQWTYIFQKKWIFIEGGLHDVYEWNLLLNQIRRRYSLTNK